MSFWNLLGGLFRSVALNILWTLLSSSFGKILESATELAQVVTSELAADNVLSNEEKRKEAAARIKARLVAEGVEVRDFIVNLAIELAVGGLKTASEDIARSI